MRVWMVVVLGLCMTCAVQAGDWVIGGKGGVNLSDDAGGRFGLEVFTPAYCNESLRLTVQAIWSEQVGDDIPQPDSPPLFRDADEEVNAWSLKAGVLYYLTPPGTSRVYVGGGGGLYFRDWEREDRTFILSTDETTGQTQEVTLSRTKDSDSGTDCVWWGMLGFTSQIGDGACFFAEAQYDFVDDFHGYSHDGLSIMAGLRWRF